MRRLHIFLALLLCAASGLTLGNVSLASPVVMPEDGAARVDNSGGPTREGNTAIITVLKHKDGSTTETEGLVGAEVVLSESLSGITADGGQVKIEGIPQGVNSFKVTCDGYFDGEGRLTPAEGGISLVGEVILYAVKKVTISVMKPDGKEGLADAKISFKEKNPTRAPFVLPADVKTGTDGKAVVDLKMGDYTYTVEHADYQTATQELTVGAESTLEAPAVTMQQQPAAIEFTFTVQEAQTAKKIAGAEIFISERSKGKTNDQGVLATQLLPGTYNCKVKHDNYQQYETQELTVSAEQNTVTVEMTPKTVTPTKYKVTITVTDMGGQPVDKAKVTVESKPAAGGTATRAKYEATTGADGKAEFELENGDYTVTIEAANLQTKTKDLTVNGGSINETMQLPPAPATVALFTVHVKDADGNVADINVTIGDQTVKSGADGNAKFENVLAAGQAKLTAVDTQDPKRYQDVAETDVTVADGQTYELTVQKVKPVDIDYVVTVISIDNDKPLANVSVTVGTKTLQTNDKGEAKFEKLAAGQYSVLAKLANYDDFDNQGKQIVVDEKHKTLTISLIPTLYELTVTVTDLEGTPVQGADVIVHVSEGTTKDDGTVVLKVKAGKFKAEAFARDFEDYVDEKEFEVSATSLKHTIKMKPYPEVIITAKDAKTGDMLSPVYVIVGDKEDITAPDGSVRFRVKPGTYKTLALAVGNLYGKYEVYEDEKPFEVKGEVTRTIKLKPLIEYTFTVTDADGTPIPEADVTVGKTEGRTDNTGKVVLLLKEGQHSAEVVAPGFAPYADEKPFTVSDTEKERSIKLEKLNPGKEVTFFIAVVDEAGEPLKDANVTIDAKSGVTNEKGVWDLITLPANVYRIKAQHANYLTEEQNVMLGEGTPGFKVVMKGMAVEFRAYTEALEPLKDAEVSINGNALGKTDDFGRLKTRLPRGTYAVKIAHADYAPFVAEELKITDNGQKVAVALKKTLPVLVSVVDDEGNAISGAEVVLADYAKGKTDEKGAVMLRVAAGQYKAKVTHPHFKDYEDATEFDVAAGQQTLHRVQMEPKDEILVLFTVLDAKGNPVEGAQIVLDDSEEVVTGKDGTVRAKVVAKTYKVNVIEYISEPIEQEIVVTEHKREFTFTLKERPTLEISILVLDDSKKPLAGATVEIEGQTLTTGDDGKVTVTVHTGKRFAVISAPKFQVKQVELDVSPAKKEFTVQMEPGAVPFTITFLDVNNQPVEGLLVTYVWVDPDSKKMYYAGKDEAGNFSTGETGADGKFSFVLLPDVYTVLIKDPQKRPYALSKIEGYELNENTKDLTYKCRAAFEYKFIVKNASGELLQGVKIALDVENAFGEIQRSLYGKTGVVKDEKGNVLQLKGQLVTLLPEGTHKYLVAHPGFIEQVGEFTVSGTGDNVLELTLETVTPVESQLLSTVNAYPNPLANVLYLDNVAEAQRVSIVTLTGATVKAQRLHGENRVMIDVQDLASGFYLVVVEAQDGVKTFKVVKN